MSELTNVVAAVIEREGRLLIAQRPMGKRHGGLWEFPGGKLEPGETVEAALRRELTEELGVRLVQAGATLFEAADDGQTFLIVFVKADIEGVPQCLEHAAIAWVDPDRLHDFQLAPSDKRFVNQQYGGSTKYDDSDDRRDL